MSGSGTVRCGLQLYTVRELARRDLLGTLDAVAELGYEGVELAGLHGVPPDAVARRAAERALTLVAAHVGLDRFEREPGLVADELHSLGIDRVVFPSTPRTSTAPDVLRTVERLTSAAEQARAAGLRPTLHNHDWEFRSSGDVRSWEAVAAIAELELELDLGWAWVAHEDPVALLRAYAGRVALVHLKDHVRLGPDSAPDRPVGDGEVEVDRIVTAAVEVGIEWLVVEQDAPGEAPLAACARSLRAVRDLLHA